jgi:hypothetical protein
MRGAQVQNDREYQRPILIALQAESVGIEQLHQRFNCPGVARYASPGTLIGACSAKESKKQIITRRGTLEFAKYVILFTICSSDSTEGVLRTYRMRW